MTRLPTAMVAIAHADAGAAALYAYVGTEVHSHLVDMLEGLQMAYMHELAGVLPADLLAKQGALRQVTAMLDSVQRGRSFSPRI